MISKITDHVSKALSRLVQQYKSSTKVNDLLDALSQPWQGLEDAVFEMHLKQFVENAEGQQLDNFGTIVGKAREGVSDADYKIALKIQIGKNISNGEAFRITNILKLLSGATLVHNQNLGMGSILLGMNVEIPSGDEDAYYQNLQEIAMGGVRVDHIVSFDPDEPFSFAGSGPVGLGFSSLGSPTTGGKLAFINRRSLPVFAFDSSANSQVDPNASGFGALSDPIAGGMFEGL